ncbi:MAG: hypothetical protein IKM48_07175 [Clostridia bacterium]|nr:hypothetical protein [Clostridia bacterium]
MIFSTAADTPRPIRLTESIRKWANDSLHGKYGDEAKKTPNVSLDHIENFEALNVLEKYNAAILEIAEKAPVRLCEEELLCGAATLGDAIEHLVPASFGGKPVYRSISHLTIGYEKVLNEGADAYAKEIAERLCDPALTEEQIAFLKSLEKVLQAFRTWHRRYLNATETARPDLHALLKQVPFSPARNFREALQSLWFTFAFVRLCGNWPGIGRIDLLLGEHLKRDLQNGTLTLEEARALLASFFIKGCEWIQSETPLGTGDAQHYQNIVLAGVDAAGHEITNEVTYLVLDIVEELPIADFPITVRLNKNSPSLLKKRMAEVMRHGGGVVALYNEDLILRALQTLDYPAEEARGFANDGCWEIQIPGKTDFSYIPFDALQIFNRVLNEKNYSSTEELYQAFCIGLKETVGIIYRQKIADAFVQTESGWKSTTPQRPTSVVSLFEEGCIENARAYRDHGTKYVVRSPHIGGAPDVANSLYAIEKLVFEENKLSLQELKEILKNNWEGQEVLRLYVKNRYTYYGNDHDEADYWHTRLLNDFAAMVENLRKEGGRPAKFIPGVSTFGRQIDWLPERSATAFGSKKGEILSGNDSPVPGTDSAGATAVIRSHCKADLARQTCGAALDLKLYPGSLNGESGITALIALMDGFLALGGFFLQLDTVDTATLLEAQRDPQRFKTLSVRVSGWNARFVTLNREWQNMIIERTMNKE